MIPLDDLQLFRLWIGLEHDSFDASTPIVVVGSRTFREPQYRLSCDLLVQEG